MVGGGAWARGRTRAAATVGAPGRGPWGGVDGAWARVPWWGVGAAATLGGWAVGWVGGWVGERVGERAGGWVGGPQVPPSARRAAPDGGGRGGGAGRRGRATNFVFLAGRPLPPGGRRRGCRRGGRGVGGGMPAPAAGGPSFRLYRSPFRPCPWRRGPGAPRRGVTVAPDTVQYRDAALRLFLFWRCLHRLCRGGNVPVAPWTKSGRADIGRLCAGKPPDQANGGCAVPAGGTPSVRLCAVRGGHGRRRCGVAAAAALRRAQRHHEMRCAL